MSTTGSLPRHCDAAFRKDLNIAAVARSRVDSPQTLAPLLAPKIQTQSASRSTRFPQPWRLALAGSVGEMNGSIAAGALAADDAGKPGVPEPRARASKPGRDRVSPALVAGARGRVLPPPRLPPPQIGTRTLPCTSYRPPNPASALLAVSSSVTSSLAREGSVAITGLGREGVSHSLTVKGW